MNRHDSVAMSVVAMSFGDLDLTWWLPCHVISRLSVAHFHQLGPCFVQFFSFSQAHIVAGTIGLAQLHSRIGPLWTITYQQTFKFKLHQIQIQIDTKCKFMACSLELISRLISQNLQYFSLTTKQFQSAYQPALIPAEQVSYGTIFFSHNKITSANLSTTKTIS